LNLLRLGLVVCVACAGIVAQGCGGGTSSTGTAGSGGGAMGAAGTSGAAGTTGAAGTSGSAGTTGAAGTIGAGGSVATGGTSGAAGTAGVTGTAGTTGAGGTTGAAGTTGSGGTAGGAGTAGRGGTGGAAGRGGTTGAAGTTGSGGTGGAVVPHGSAAKFICPQGQTFGNPLTGVGTISQVTAPTQPAGEFFGFIEGPVWIAGAGTVFFSDNVQPERIYKLVPPSTMASRFLSNSGSNGLAVDNNDNLVLADQAMRRIARVNPTTGQMVGAAITTTAKPNDVIVRSDDNIYFTDPDSGFYRISPTGTVSAAMKFTNSSRPNGIELSLDENALYVGDVGNSTIVKYMLAADGAVMTGTGAMFASAQPTHNTFDGMCVDCAGNVYVGTSGGVEVYSSTGAYIGTVMTGEASNCTFGGADRKTLYVTSRSVLKYVTLAVPGLPD
jgi:gluconolactonase